MKKRLLFTSAIALAGFASVATAADYDCSSLGNTNRKDRTVTALSLVDDQGSSLTINPVQPDTNPQPIYFDKSSEYTFTTVPGATVTVTPTSSAEWMHSYMYIDWAGDGFAFSQYSDYMDVVSDTEFALRPGVDLVAFTRWRPNSSYSYHDHNGPNASYGGGQKLNEPFSFTIPADAKGGTYRIRYKSAYNQLDPNGVADIFESNTLVSNGGCICDFTLVIEGEEEPAPVVDYDLSSLGNVHWQIGVRRSLTELELTSDGQSLKIGPIRGDGQSDIAKRNSIYHDHSDEVIAVSAGSSFTLKVNGGVLQTQFDRMSTYVYVDWGKDGFNYTQPSDYVDVETSKPLEGSDLVAHNGWSKDGTGADAVYRDSNGEIVENPNFIEFPHVYQISIPEGTEPGLYRARVKNHKCSLDPNGGQDYEGSGLSISYLGGTIVDFTIEVKEPEPVVDYDLSSLGKVHWQLGTNRFLTDITVKSSASKLVLSPIRGDGQSDLEKRNSVYHDHSDQEFAIEAGDVFHLSVNGGTFNANYKNMPTYVYIDWGKDGFIYSTPSDYVDVETSIPHPDSDLVAHNGWSKDGKDGQHRDYNGEDVTSTPAFPYDFEIFIPEDTKPGKYRLRVKNAMCSLDPNGGQDFEDISSTIQRTGGTIVDFTIDVKEPGSGPVLDPIDPATLEAFVNPVGTDLEWTVGTCCYEKVGESNGANGAVSQMTDGNKSNYWHSAYESASAPHTGHHYFTFDLKEEREIGGFNWTSRTSAPAADALEHGMLRSWEIYVADNADEFAFADNAAMEAYRASHEAAATGTCNVQYASNEFSVTFTSLVKGQYFLLVATEVGQKGSWITNNYEFLHCAEFSFLATPKPVDTVLAYNTFNQYLSWTISEFCCEEPTNEQPSGTIDKLIDNDPSTFYHSHWANSDEPHGTHYFVVDLKKARDIYGFAWTPRQSSGSNNGIWQTYHMFASDDKSAFDFGAQLGDKEYSNITARHTDLEALVNAYVEENGAEGRTGTLSATGGSAAETAMFAKPLNGRYVLMVITESNRSLSCAAELGFYFEDTEELRDELNGGGGPSEEDMLAEIRAKLNAYIELIKTYKQSVPFAYLDGALGEVEEIAGMPEFFLEDYEIIDQVLYAMIGAPVEDVILNALYDEVDRLWTLYQPGQNGYLCADTKSTNQDYDSFNFQSNADDNSLWTIVPSEFADHFYLRSAKGQYIATPKQHYCRADATIDEAGLFAFGVKDGYVTFESVAFPGCGLGLDGKNDPAEIMSLEDGSLGYRWQVSLTDKPVVVEPQPVAVTVTPAAGVVGYLSNISFFIADVDYSINTECTEPVTLTSETAVIESLDAEGLANHYDAKAQKYYIDCNLTENGTYTLTIPEATFKGENIYSKETVVVWTIENNGIVSVTVNGEEVEAYDLQGRRVNNVTKGGLYIINGVKTLVK